MMPVMEVSRKRAMSKVDVPGLYRSSHTKSKNSKSEQQTMPATCGSGNIVNTRSHASTSREGPMYDTRRQELVMMTSKSLSKVNRKPVHHMTSAIEVGKKRSKNRSTPPGFSALLNPDANNNSKGLAKTTQNTANQSADKISESSKQTMESSDSPSKLKKALYIPECVRGVTSELSLAVRELRDDLRSVRPDCLKGSTGKLKIKLKNPIKEKVTKLKQILEKSKPEFTIYQREEELCGEQVTVNVMLGKVAEDDDGVTIELRETITPDNYGESFAYFENESKNRVRVFQAFYGLADMLLMDEIEGDKDAWKEYTEKVDEEIKVWKEKCKKNQEHFNETREVLTEDMSICDRVIGFARQQQKRVRGWLIALCPCF